MTSKLKKLKDLNRKLTVNVETKKYDDKYQAKLSLIFIVIFFSLDINGQLSI